MSQGAPPSIGRQATALVTGAAAAAVAALMLGEYDLSGLTPYVAGVLFGLVVAEVVLTVARRGTPLLGGLSAAACGLGFGWAIWISTDRGRAPTPGGAWVGLVLAVLVGGGWVLLPPRRKVVRESLDLRDP